MIPNYHQCSEIQWTNHNLLLISETKNWQQMLWNILKKPAYWAPTVSFWFSLFLELYKFRVKKTF